MFKAGLGIFVLFVNSVFAQESGVTQIELPKMLLNSKSLSRPEGDVVDKKIISGKKVDQVTEEMIPSLPNNNFRQILGNIPGVLSSEVNNESFLSITTRGMGDPHESFNLLLLRNGLPAAADPYGYPAAYYAPPAEGLDSISFYRGGAGLLFGPQPGGAFDLKLKEAPQIWQKLKIETTNLGGSFGRYSSYTESSQSQNGFAHLFSLHARGAEGFRNNNSDSKVLNPRANFRWDVNEQRSLSLDLEHYEGSFAEPVGINRTDSYSKTTLNNDLLEIERSQLTLGWKENWPNNWSSHSQVWTTQLNRTSYRQTLGGAPAFGGVAQGLENRIQAQNFNMLGSDIRTEKKYLIQDWEQVLTLALSSTWTKSPYTQENGANPQAKNGILAREIDRETQSTAFIIENAFHFDSFVLTPGLRVEEIRQTIDENLNLGSLVPLRNAQNINQVTLLGFGLEYNWNENWKSFLNLSEGYKPASFQDSVPLGSGDVISEDIQEARTWSREVGLRLSQESTSVEISAFDVRFSNQFGRVGNEFRNIGASRSEGLDLSFQHQVNSQIKLSSGLSLLKAEITRGALTGRENQYSPDQMIRWGVLYRYSRDSQVQVQNQWLSEHYGDDANSPNYKIPSYSLFDFSAEQRLPKILDSQKTLLKWGVQNLFDHKYFSRVRSNGIEPGQPRSIYGGLTLVY
jgi:Fe(3+) dicitrate transport protein